MSDRPTPETDAFIGDQDEALMTEGEIAMCAYARNLERQRDEARSRLRNATLLSDAYMHKMEKACCERDELTDLACELRDALDAVFNLPTNGSGEMSDDERSVWLTVSDTLTKAKEVLK